MLLCVLVLALLTPPGEGADSWQNTSLSSLRRTNALIASLSLDEKVSLLQTGQPAIDRIGLPAYNFGRECERGDTSGKLGTAYPTGLALAGTFDIELVHSIAAATAIEVRGNVNSDTADGGAVFGASCFGPVSNLVRDPRWGRAAEMVTGEDPQLGRIMSRAFTWGMQQRLDENSTARMLNTIAKHLNSYGGPEGTGFTFGSTAQRFNFDAKLTEREWREFFLPPFYGAAEAGVSGFMCSYSSISFTDHPERSSNTPSCAHEYMLEQVVRKQWNWTGYVLSDAGAAAFVGSTQIGKPGDRWHESNKTFGHGYARSASDAAIKALQAGLDLELTCCGAPAVFPTLSQSVQAGRIQEALVDRSLRRTLPIRFELGQLDGSTASSRAGVPQNSYARLNREQNVSTPQMIRLAEAAARKAVVLLKNDNKTLPLNKAEFIAQSDAATPKTLCMFGPNANSTHAQEAGYVNQHPRFISTPFAGLVGTLGRNASVKLVPGCNTTRCDQLDTAAVAAALQPGVCDVMIAVLGLTAYSNPGSHLQPLSQEPGNACGCIPGDGVEGECCDRLDVALPGQQLALLQMIAAAAAAGNRPVVLISVNAGELDLSWAKQSSRVPSILLAPYLGMSTGTALAATLFGEANPAARLSTTWYHPSSLEALGPITSYQMHPSSTRPGRTYRYYTADVLFPFGFGLSYSQFSYATTEPPAAVVEVCDIITIRVHLSLISGPQPAEEVVQLYLSIHNSSVTVPRHQLVSFQRPKFSKDDPSSRLLTFSILPEDQAILRNPDFDQTVEPGLRSVWVGGGQPGTGAAGVALSFEVQGRAKSVQACPSGRAAQEWGSRNPDAHLWAP